MNINHERLVPGAITYWGDVVGDINDQQDLVDYVASHGGGGGGDATWGSIQGTLSNQTDLNDRLTEINGLAQDAYNQAQYDYNTLNDHIQQNNAAFNEAFERISALEQGGGGGGVTPEEFNAHKAQNDAAFAEAFDRISALEQNPGVSQQDFDGLQQDFNNHVVQNEAAFGEAFDRISALEQGGGVSQQDFSAHVAENAAQFQAIDNQFQAIDNQFQAIDNQFQDYATEQWVWDQNFIENNGEGWEAAWTHDVSLDPDYAGKTAGLWISKFYDLDYNQNLFGVVDDNGDSLSFRGFCFEARLQQFGLYKVDGIEEDPENAPGEITYETTFIPFVAAEEPDTSTDASYVLKATVLNGEVTYSWVPDNVL